MYIILSARIYACFWSRCQFLIVQQFKIKFYTKINQKLVRYEWIVYQQLSLLLQGYEAQENNIFFIRNQFSVPWFPNLNTNRFG